MTKEVLINISGLQMDVDPENPIEMVTTGAYYLKNGKHYILYDELSEDNEVTKCRTYKKRSTGISYDL